MQGWSWDSLRAVVQDVIDNNGIGRPAALRLTYHGRAGDSGATSYRQEAESIAAAWFGSKPASTYSIGGGGDGPGSSKPTVTALKWESGQSAILSISSGANGRVGGNLMLMGTHGTVYHEIGDTESGSD